MILSMTEQEKYDLLM